MPYFLLCFNIYAIYIAVNISLAINYAEIPSTFDHNFENNIMFREGTIYY